MSETTVTVTPVLMYHAIDEAWAACADPHYSVSRPNFSEQLRAITAAGKGGLSVLNLLTGQAKLPAVAITFDDGLVSNRHAAETLAAVGMSADFFVNPSTIGQPGFLSWQDLREMLAMGMSIQSHGMTHRYLSDLSAPEVERELVQSKQQIEQAIGAAVVLFAPPGGRMPANFGRLAGRAGYRAVCSSAVGFWQMPGKISLSSESESSAESLEIPRLAVLAQTDREQFERWIHCSRRELFVLQSRGKVLNLAKRAVGNQRYEKLRQAIIGGVPQ